MARVLGPTLNKLYQRANTKGTNSTYKSNWNQWVKFCEEFFHDPMIVNNELILSYYVTWKFLTTKNKAKYIDKTVSGIISTWNRQSLNFQIDRSKFAHLRSLIKAIETFPGRQSNEKFPIRDPILLKLIRVYKNNYNGILKKTMLAFAKTFALRIGEYTTPYGYPTSRTLKWKDLFFLKKIINFMLS